MAVRSTLPEGREKTRFVEAMFDRIAPRYDRLNRLLTAGLDRRWRRRAVELAQLRSGERVLDLGCGTGDLCRGAAAAGARVVGVDRAARMLDLAKARGIPAAWVRADAAALPLAEASVDAVLSAFAARNFTSLAAVLREAARVLVDRGRLVILEVDEPRSRWLRLGHRLYFHRAVPWIGGLLSDRSAYAYLPRSTAYLPPPDGLRALLEAAGFEAVRRHPLSAGVVQVVVAVRRHRRASRLLEERRGP